VVRPPPWPKGWPATPLGGSSSSCTLLLSRFFFSVTGGWPSHPLGLGVASHPLGIGHLHFFFAFNWGWFGHPLRPWGGSATTRPAGLVVAEPPPWPRVWPATLWVDATSFFFFFLSFFFFFRLKILKLNFQKLIF
jgi:hypothetical protein